MEMFEQAARAKLRFEFMGTWSVEDLFDMPLTSEKKVSLDGIAKDLNRKLRDSDQDISFVSETPAQKANFDQLRFDIVRHVIAVKKQVAAQAAEANQRAEMRRRALDVLAKRKEAAFENMSDEELMALAK